MIAPDCAKLMVISGPYFLPDDEGHGYHGRFLKDDGLETSPS